MNSGRPLAPMDASVLVEHMLVTPFTCLLGYHGARQEACNAAAWFADHWESQGVDWRIIVISGTYRLSLKNFGEIASLIKFDTLGNRDRTVGGRYGFVRAVSPHAENIEGVIGDNILWFIGEETPIEIWDSIVASCVSGTKILAVNPPSEKMALFEYRGE